MTPAQVEGWCNGAVASGYNAATLESQIAIPYWGGGAVKPPGGGGDDFYRRTWREVIAVLAAHADLPRLALTVEMSECTWVYIEDAILWEEFMTPEEIRPIFRFIYDFYIDVSTALCELRGLGALELRLSVFEHLRPWLEREVLGRSKEPKVEGAHERRRRSQWYHMVPQWHDGDRRLEGSNYRPPGQSDES
ncbi:hypothetical protein VPNG_07289 [Cytospora leucostoma]|uniref:Uncharacterized protein n=1 Tax=Cytospora leucostoma TaxID=1230097 RepID=A0A423WK87_9PEZI|nr:hypothetical protein VPNG_07289 [Cytospora leucostoma]